MYTGDFMARTKRNDVPVDAEKRKYRELPMPVGRFNPRQKRIWHDLVSQINPGHVALGAEQKLLERLVKSYWRAEVLEEEYEEIFSKNETSLSLGGNGNITTHPILAALEKTQATIGMLSTKLRLCPHSRLESRTNVVTSESIHSPKQTTDGDRIDRLFGGAGGFPTPKVQGH